MFRNLTSPKVRPELPIAVSVATDDVFAAIAVKDSLSWDKQNGPQKNGYDHQQSTSINKHQRPIQQEPNCTQHTRVETCRQQPTTRKVCKKRLLNYSLSTLSAFPFPLPLWPFPLPLPLPPLPPFPPFGPLFRHGGGGVRLRSCTSMFAVTCIV